MRYARDHGPRNMLEQTVVELHPERSNTSITLVTPLSYRGEFALIRPYAKSHNASRSVNAAGCGFARFLYDLAHIHGNCSNRGA
jgi:hypothetical protein